MYGCGYFALQGDWRTDCTLSEFHALDDGFDYYAPQSFAAADGRRIQFGWMGMPDADYTNATVEYGWQHCLTLPGELTWRDGKILRTPIRELEDLGWRPAELKNGRCRWGGQTVKLLLTEIGGERRKIRIGKEGNCLTISCEGNRVELSFLDENGNAARCGGGRRTRVGRTSGPVDQMLILIDSSIARLCKPG